MFVRAQKSGLYETEGHNLAKTSVSHRHTLSVRFNIPEVPEIVCKKKKQKKKWDKKKKHAGGGAQRVAVGEEAANRELNLCPGWNIMISKRGRAWGSTFHLACLKKLNAQQLVFLRN